MLEPNQETILILGEEIRARRLDLAMSMEDLAACTGLSRNGLGAIERGEAEVLFLHLVGIAKGLGIPLSELIASIERRAES